MEAARNWILCLIGWSKCVITICRRWWYIQKYRVNIINITLPCLLIDGGPPVCRSASCWQPDRHTRPVQGWGVPCLDGQVSCQIQGKADARYYVLVAIRQSLMIMSKVLLRVEIEANYNVWWTYHPKQWHSSCSASAETALQVKICSHEAFLAARAALYLLVWVHNLCRMWVTE